MTPSEWDRHRVAYCWRCARHNRGCYTYCEMVKDPECSTGAAMIWDGVCIIFEPQKQKQKQKQNSR